MPRIPGRRSEMRNENVYERGVAQLKSVDAVRIYQREWMEKTRERVKQGEPFAICNGDEFEEIFNVMDIPVIVVNYYNFLTIIQGKEEYYRNVLIERGYDEGELFAYGLATTLDNNPEKAPWGGLPKPTIIIGGSKSDTEMRVLEIWAREFGCTFFPLEFCYDPTPEQKLTQPNWVEKVYDHWDQLYDPLRLDLRVKEDEALIAFLEVTTGRTFSIAKLIQSIELNNEQMAYWDKADELIAFTVPCPVSWRDRQAVMQAKWHRGTVRGRDFIKAYYEEVKERVEKGIAACPNEKIRLFGAFANPPTFSRYLQEEHGAVFVPDTQYTGTPYRRAILNNDPLRTLAARQMAFSFETPEWFAKDANRQQIDGMIEDPHVPHRNREALEKAGIPVLTVPRDKDDAEVRAMLDRFIEEISSKKK
jgi:hypothetical protein